MTPCSWGFRHLLFFTPGLMPLKGNQLFTAQGKKTRGLVSKGAGVLLASLFSPQEGVPYTDKTRYIHGVPEKGFGCGSKPMGSHFGVHRCTTHFRTYFSGILTYGHSRADSTCSQVLSLDDFAEICRRTGFRFPNEWHPRITQVG